MHEKQILFKIRFLIILFVIGLVLSGITAFPLERELSYLVNHISFLPEFMQNWLNTVYEALKYVGSNYPFLNYGTDWLAFAHLVIAAVFWGPLKDPVKNIWVIQFGMIACIMVFPLALIAGPIRGIPFFWRLIDCSFGIVGFIPLAWCYKLTKRLENLKIKPNIA